MRKVLPAFVAGLTVATALLVSLVAFGQADIIATIKPTIIDIQQQVPVMAEIDGATVPITVDLSLQVSLSGPVTVTAESTEPIVEVGEPGPEPIVGVDDLGIPYTILVDGEGLEISEWTVYQDPDGYFAYAGEVHALENAGDIKDTVGVIWFYGPDEQLIGVREIYIGSYFEEGNLDLFDGTEYTDPELIGSYAVEVTIVGP